jgi:hypothetical protein
MKYSKGGDVTGLNRLTDIFTALLGNLSLAVDLDDWALPLDIEISLHFDGCCGGEARSVGDVKELDGG